MDWRASLPKYTEYPHERLIEKADGSSYNNYIN